MTFAMNAFFALAGVLALAIGLAHSVFGERLIFRRMRAGGVVPVNGGDVLREPHVRILWASWHALTVCGWCLGVVLMWLAQPANAHLATSVLSASVVVALMVSGVLVLVGTRGKHPGWLGLLIAAGFAWMGMLK